MSVEGGTEMISRGFERNGLNFREWEAERRVW